MTNGSSASARIVRNGEIDISSFRRLTGGQLRKVVADVVPAGSVAKQRPRRRRAPLKIFVDEYDVPTLLVDHEALGRKPRTDVTVLARHPATF